MFESQLDDLFARLKWLLVNEEFKSLLSSLFGVVCVPGNFIGVLLAKNGFAPICEFCMVSSVFTPIERVLMLLLSDYLYWIPKLHKTPFESQLDDLFARLKCRECDCTVDMSDTVKDCSSGTILRVSVFCTNGHLIHRWLSQPLKVWV
jgi:hypothetical protein